jgi:hypothetical protein
VLGIDQTSRILSTAILHLMDEYKSVDRFALWEHYIHFQVIKFQQQNKPIFSNDQV